MQRTAVTLQTSEAWDSTCHVLPFLLHFKKQKNYIDHPLFERGISSVVERPLCMREARGSNPLFSIREKLFAKKNTQTDGPSSTHGTVYIGLLHLPFCTYFLEHTLMRAAKIKKKKQKYEVAQQWQVPRRILSWMLSECPFQGISFRRSVARLAHFPIHYKSCLSTFRPGANIHPKLHRTSNLLRRTTEHKSSQRKLQHTTPHLGYRKTLQSPSKRKFEIFATWSLDFFFLEDCGLCVAVHK